MKKIIIVFFGIIMSLTTVFWMLEYFRINGDDIMGNQLDIIFTLILLVISLVVELGWYYCCKYFLFKKEKKAWKTLYYELMIGISCIIVASFCGRFLGDYGLWSMILLAVFVLYVIVWIRYGVRCIEEKLEI